MQIFPHRRPQINERYIDLVRNEWESSMNINLSFGFINFASFMYLEAKVQVISIVKSRRRAILTSAVGKWRKLYAKERMARRLPEDEEIPLFSLYIGNFVTRNKKIYW